LNPLKIVYLILKSILLNLLLNLKIKEKHLRRKLTMAKDSNGKILNQKKPKSSQSPEQTTEEIKDKDQEETKPKFQELLSKDQKDPAWIESSKKSSPPGSEEGIPEDANIEEVCADVIAIPFAIWHELNKNVEPLSEKEKRNISKPLAKVVAKYDLGKYMKEELVLVFYLGSAIYGRAKVKKDDKDHNREKGTGEDEPDARINPERAS